MDPGEAIKSHPKGCVISFEIVPRCRRISVPSGYNPWRRSLEARLTEEPIKGRANRQLMEELARILRVSEQKVEMMSGQKSSKKSILVQGINRDEAWAVLAQKLATTDAQKAENDDRRERI
jgi:uncharacterized protein (TIGR00251 family)